jgi:GNAT superfamily N-acetyltransferase
MYLMRGPDKAALLKTAFSDDLAFQLLLDRGWIRLAGSKGELSLYLETVPTEAQTRTIQQYMDTPGAWFWGADVGGAVYRGDVGFKTTAGRITNFAREHWKPKAALGRISDLCSGTPLGREVWDYSCVLPSEMHERGYKLRVDIGPSGNYIRVSLRHPSAPHEKQLREGEVGFVSGVKSGTSLVVGESFVTESFRGKGLAVPLYEALFRHAQSMGVKSIEGTAHSSPAAAVHQKLATKHGLAYRAFPAYGEGKNWETRNEWAEAPSGAYDEKWGPYSYALNGPPGLGADPRTQALAEFKRAIQHVWRNADFVLPVVGISPEEPGNDSQGLPVYASIAFVRGQGDAAIGDSLLRRAPAYVLRVSGSFANLSPENQWRVLVHEAVHLGYPGHGQKFRDLCTLKGGAVSGRAVLDPGVKAEKKVGSRYQVQRTFTDEREATRWAKEQQKAEPGSRWRLSLGGVGATKSPKDWNALLAAQHLPPAAGDILDARYRMGSNDWYHRTKAGWFWYDDRTKRWVPAPLGPD